MSYVQHLNLPDSLSGKTVKLNLGEVIATCEVKVNDNYSYFVEIRKIENTVDDGTDKLRSF